MCIDVLSVDKMKIVSLVVVVFENVEILLSPLEIVNRSLEVVFLNSLKSRRSLINQSVLMCVCPYGKNSYDDDFAKKICSTPSKFLIIRQSFGTSLFSLIESLK